MKGFKGGSDKLLHCRNVRTEKEGKIHGVNVGKEISSIKRSSPYSETLVGGARTISSVIARYPDAVEGTRQFQSLQTVTKSHFFISPSFSATGDKGEFPGKFIALIHTDGVRDYSIATLNQAIIALKFHCEKIVKKILFKVNRPITQNSQGGMS